MTEKDRECFEEELAGGLIDEFAERLIGRPTIVHGGVIVQLLGDYLDRFPAERRSKELAAIVETVSRREGHA